MSNSDRMANSATQAAKDSMSNGVFLLIDTAQFPAIWRILEYRFRRLPWLSLCDDPSDAGSGPVLVHVTMNQTKTLAWFLEHTQGTHCLSWIVSPLGLIDLREHMRQLMRVLAEDGSEYLMRYYDTRILPVWYQTLSAEQEIQAMGPINSWTYLDRDHMPCTVFGQGKANTGASANFTITPTQEQALLDAALPDIVIQELTKLGNADLAALTPAESFRFIAEQIDKAKKQYGIKSVADLILFCELALSIGKNFDKLSSVAQILQGFVQVGADTQYSSAQGSRQQLA